MGKRELLLVFAFVIVGAVVYQATAPPPGPNDRGFSFGKLVDHVRREIRGNRATAERTSNATHPIDDEVTELRITGALLAEVNVQGEDRDDLETSLRVTSNAYNDEEAKRYAELTKLKVDRSASALTLSMDYVTGRQTGRQRAFLTVKVPSRLRVRVEVRPSKMTIANVASVEATNAGGETAIRSVPGRVTVTHRGGPIVIDDVASLRFRGRSSDARISGVHGDTAITAEAGGRLRVREIEGALDVEMRDVEGTFDKIEDSRGPIRVNATNATLRIRGISADTRIDGRNTEIEADIAGAAPVSIYNEGREVTLTPPASGYRLDMLAIEGSIGPEATIEKLKLKVERGADNRETRVAGGTSSGAAITVRATRAEVTLREPGTSSWSKTEREDEEANDKAIEQDAATKPAAKDAKEKTPKER